MEERALPCRVYHKPARGEPISMGLSARPSHALAALRWRRWRRRQGSSRAPRNMVATLSLGRGSPKRPTVQPPPLSPLAQVVSPPSPALEQVSPSTSALLSPEQVSPELSELSPSQLDSPSLVSLELSPEQLSSLLLDELSPEQAP